MNKSFLEMRMVYMLYRSKVVNIQQIVKKFIDNRVQYDKLTIAKRAKKEG